MLLFSGDIAIGSRERSSGDGIVGGSFGSGDNFQGFRRRNDHNRLTHRPTKMENRAAWSSFVLSTQHLQLITIVFLLFVPVHSFRDVKHRELGKGIGKGGSASSRGKGKGGSAFPTVIPLEFPSDQPSPQPSSSSPSSMPTVSSAPSTSGVAPSLRPSSSHAPSISSIPSDVPSDIPSMFPSTMT
jgi:hypothetical protein